MYTLQNKKIICENNFPTPKSVNTIEKANDATIYKRSITHTSPFDMSTYFFKSYAHLANRYRHCGDLDPLL